MKLYLCDAEKNTECEKKRCHLNGGPCYHTLNKDMAKNVQEEDE